MKTERLSAEEMAGFGIAQMNRVEKLISGTKINYKLILRLSIITLKGAL